MAPSITRGGDTRSPITEHCVLRYRERVGPRPPKYPSFLPLSACRADLEEALSRPPLFIKVELDGCKLVGMLNRVGFPFVVKIGLDGAAETCGPCYFWKETRHLWRQFGYDGYTAKRREEVNSDVNSLAGVGRSSAQIYNSDDASTLSGDGADAAELAGLRL
jgi:hypothetical protein